MRQASSWNLKYSHIYGVIICLSSNYQIFYIFKCSEKSSMVSSSSRFSNLNIGKETPHFRDVKKRKRKTRDLKSKSSQGLWPQGPAIFFTGLDILFLNPHHNHVTIHSQLYIISLHWKLLNLVIEDPVIRLKSWF